MHTKTQLRIPGFDVKIGDRVRDEITGYEGILTSHVLHITGCDTAWVTTDDPKVGKDEKEKHFDLPRLELVDSNPKGIQEIPSEVPAAG